MHFTCLKTQLRVGDTQSLVFKIGDSGPFYLSPEQRELQRHDRPTGRHKLVEKSKKLLVNSLKEAGVLLQQQQSYSKKELQEYARSNNVDLFEQRETVVPGWQGQPKGLLQVLWERGNCRFDTSLPIAQISKKKKQLYNT